MAEYTAYYLQTEGGRFPVEEFIDGLDQAAQRKFFFKRSLLEEFGPRLPQPHAKQLAENLYELRLETHGVQIRAFYCCLRESWLLRSNVSVPTLPAPGVTEESEGEPMNGHPRLKPVADHLKDKRRHPAFRELQELDEEKLKVAKVIIGERIRRGVSQAALAKRLGVTQQQVSKLENGDFDNLAALQRVLTVLGYQVRVSAIPLHDASRTHVARN